jgi:hypothetical protein
MGGARDPRAASGDPPDAPGLTNNSATSHFNPARHKQARRFLKADAFTNVCGEAAANSTRAACSTQPAPPSLPRAAPATAPIAEFPA